MIGFVPGPRRSAACALFALGVVACTQRSAPHSVPPKPAPAPVSKASYRVVDATQPFWSFWDAYGTKSPEQRLAGFRSEVIAKNPSLFSDGVIGKDPTIPDELDGRLPEWLASLDERISVMKKITASIDHDLGRFDQSFRKTFPDMSWKGTVYFTVSIDAFDGALRQVDDDLALLFGIDKIAKIYGDDVSLGPLFHHELFHLHHQALCKLPEPTEQGPNGLWPPLWMEGLAVYVAHHLNPDATLKQLTLSDELVREADPKLPALAKELLKLLDDAREEDFRDYFLSAGKRDDVPKRVGYYIGYRIASSLAKEMPFEKLVRLCGEELRADIERELQRLIAEQPLLPRGEQGA